MSWHSFRPYVTSGERRAKAAKQVATLFGKGRKLSPIRIEGREIARTFWGEAWCTHLESFSDFAHRLPRGRTYLRNGSVIEVFGIEIAETWPTLQPRKIKKKTPARKAESGRTSSPRSAAKRRRARSDK